MKKIKIKSHIRRITGKIFPVSNRMHEVNLCGSNPTSFIFLFFHFPDIPMQFESNNIFKLR